MKVKISDLIEIPEFKNLYSIQNNDDLVQSFRDHGQMNPIHISERNEIINGYRMVSAIKKNGGTTVEAIVRKGVPTLYDRILLNQYRKKTTEDEIREIKLVFEKFPKRQGKKDPNGKKYVRDEEISRSLNNRFRGDQIIKQLEYIIENDMEGDVLLKQIVNNVSGVDPCHDFLRNHKKIDEEKKFGFTDRMVSGEFSVSDVIKLIKQTDSLDQEYKYSFDILKKAYARNIDCVEISKMEEFQNMVDLIFTSPPYYDLRKYLNGDLNQLGHEETAEKYCENVAKIIGALVPTLKQTANVMINVGESYEDGVGYGIPRLLTNAILANTTLRYMDTLIWSKSNPKPQNETVKRPINNLEYILWFVVDPKKSKYNMITYPKKEIDVKISKGVKDVDSNGKVWGKNLSISKPYKKIFSHLKEQEIENIIECSVGRNHEVYNISTEGHPAIMSSLLPSVPILMTTDEGNTVFDPFSGTSVVGRMSCLLNRVAVNAELSEKYFKIGCKMLENSVAEFDRVSLDIINSIVYSKDSNPQLIPADNLKINRDLKVSPKIAA